MIAKQCNNQLENTRAVINQSVTSGRPQIKWTVGIPRVKECKAARCRFEEIVFLHRVDNNFTYGQQDRGLCVSQHAKPQRFH
ncbi:hypothetical protein PSHT_03593 [Puccinia striiformis]|uniref:Uncharacterized protein n=1 Tax=Puccinia striiformis TaxID=27350 RepID=A0A2S4WF60_9BASI|nr:hypothetical protein PSHT_03593 [Puccinia striiformis]